MAGDPTGKMESIERFDRHFLGELLSGIKEHDSLIITCDHSTPCELGIHSSDKVPVVIYGPDIVPDDTQAFGESIAKKHGALGIERAIQILPYLFDKQKR